MKIQVLVSEVHIVPVEIEVEDLSSNSLCLAREKALKVYEDTVGDKLVPIYSHTTEPETWQVKHGDKIIAENA